VNQKDPYLRFQSLRTFLAVSGLTITSPIAKNFLDRVPNSKEAMMEWLIIFMYFAIPVSIWAVIVYALLPFAMEAPWFRRRILGRRYIEGTWVEKINESDGTVGITIIEIQPNGEYFTITGSRYDECGTLDVSFKTQIINFEWPDELKYSYSNDEISRDSQGIGTFRFVIDIDENRERPSVPNRFHGGYKYAGKKGDAKVEGWKLKPSEVTALNQDRTKRELLEKYIAEFGRKPSGSMPAAGQLSAIT
jgi:hypothetical protein